MKSFQWIASLALAATIVPALAAETHCPGNAASLPLHLVNRHLFIVTLAIPHSGLERTLKGQTGQNLELLC